MIEFIPTTSVDWSRDKTQLQVTATGGWSDTWHRLHTWPQAQWHVMPVQGTVIYTMWIELSASFYAVKLCNTNSLIINYYKIWANSAKCQQSEWKSRSPTPRLQWRNLTAAAMFSQSCRSRLRCSRVEYKLIDYWQVDFWFENALWCFMIYMTRETLPFAEKIHPNRAKNHRNVPPNMSNCANCRSLGAHALWAGTLWRHAGFPGDPPVFLQDVALQIFPSAQRGGWRENYSLKN